MYLRQAIITKYHGPTNTRGSRISATAEAGRIYVPYDHSLSLADNHAAAAKAFAAKWEWTGTWAGGGARSMHAWVMIETDRGIIENSFTV